MLIGAHEHAYAFAPASMHFIVCGVCVAAYLENNEWVYVDLQLLVRGQHGAKGYYTHI